MNPTPEVCNGFALGMLIGCIGTNFIWILILMRK